MPQAANFRILQADRLELSSDTPPFSLELAAFAVPTSAVTQPTVLSFMAYALDRTPVGRSCIFSLLLNERVVLRPMIQAPLRAAVMLFHAHSADEFQFPGTAVSTVIPVTTPTILQPEGNTLSARLDTTFHPGFAGVAFSDIVLWWQQDV
jgi:hypothetical protein